MVVGMRSRFRSKPVFGLQVFFSSIFAASWNITRTPAVLLVLFVLLVPCVQEEVFDAFILGSTECAIFFHTAQATRISCSKSPSL